jgi:hypothetical protein
MFIIKEGRKATIALSEIFEIITDNSVGETFGEMRKIKLQRIEHVFNNLNIKEEMTMDRDIESEELKKYFDDFVQTMKRRITDKEQNGWTGWDDAGVYPDIEFIARAMNKLILDRDKISMADVANYALFLFARLDMGKKCEFEYKR